MSENADLNSGPLASVIVIITRVLEKVTAEIEAILFEKGVGFGGTGGSPLRQRPGGLACG
jgi:hypothetical protein